MSNTFLKQTVKKFLVASYFLVPGGHFGPLETKESLQSALVGADMEEPTFPASA